ncbi:tyrosine-type recombinase/integrase (plasmid) [Rhizobium lusitanum]|uniref:tyrosine-type recombinase/integrase n=1 Tax=Rhizobium lusitanum TaxID=293958 RepID=UPI001614C602|nr:tyrosine-type recombinase/integrase [Rhizobium lusitanum]QND44637.1 tyrosine-type recombinase/integrase [Rhizobium lusitanum]
MTKLHGSLETYLLTKRALGFKLNDEGKLRNFVAFMDRRGATVVTGKLAIEWAGSSAGPATWAIRLSAVRTFARYLADTAPLTEIPPTGVFPQHHRPQPHIYTAEEIEALLSEIKRWRSRNGFGQWTFHCCIGLLAVTGMRLGEAIRLKRSDVDLDAGVISVEESKFGKSRIVPVHQTTVAVLRDYCERRDASPPRRLSDHFFVGERGKGLHIQRVELVFITSIRRAGLRGAVGTRGPRIHDLRHTYAVNTLLRWYESGDDVDRMLPVLSTYLGHTHTRDTYWYLSACPELMRHAADRLERRWGATP